MIIESDGESGDPLSRTKNTGQKIDSNPSSPIVPENPKDTEKVVHQKYPKKNTESDVDLW